MGKIFYSFRLIGIELFLRYVRSNPHQINPKSLAIRAICHAAQSRGCKAGPQVTLHIPEIADVIGVPAQYMAGFADALTGDFDAPITADYAAGYVDGVECRAAL